MRPSKNLPLFSEEVCSQNPAPFFYEGLACSDGYDMIAGVDEAGRGPLAGPVVAAAVIIPKGICLDGIQDSKKMTAKAREKAFSVIHSQCQSVGLGVVSHKYIDEFDILKASLEAMRRAVLSLNKPVEYLLVDGIHPVPLPIPQRCIIKGDQLSRSISAASVFAKVYRDRIMYSYHNIYPEYGFDRNKGYGTRRHFEAIKQYGASPIHRLSFKGVCRM